MLAGAETTALFAGAVNMINGPVALSFLASLVGWLVGAGEVYLILMFMGHPVSWATALLLDGNILDQGVSYKRTIFQSQGRIF